jgi:hypothetical protein
MPLTACPVCHVTNRSAALLAHVMFVVFGVFGMQRVFGAVLVFLLTALVVVTMLVMAMRTVFVLVAMVTAAMMLELGGLLVRGFGAGRRRRLSGFFLRHACNLHKRID